MKENHRRLWKYGALLAGIAVGLFLFIVSPEKFPLYPRCVFHSLTGLQCPGCGGLRALHFLLHGQIATAFSFNPLLVVSVPVLVGAWFYCRWRRSAGSPVPNLLERPLFIWLLLVIMVGFAVLRNLPFGPLAHLHR